MARDECHADGILGDREELAREQAALVRALAGQSDAPPGFDARNVATAASALLAKRRHGVERTWPGLAASLGERFPQVFADYARSHSIPPGGHSADGRLFARHLLRAGLLDDAGRTQLLLAEMGRLPIAFACLPEARRIVIAYRSFHGVRWFTLPWIFPNRSLCQPSRIAAGAEEGIGRT